MKARRGGRGALDSGACRPGRRVDGFVEGRERRTASSSRSSFSSPRDRTAVIDFLTTPELALPWTERVTLVRRFVHVTNHVRGYHTLAEMLRVTQAILRRKGRRGLTVVEAGSAFGGSTAKLSLAVAAAGGRLLVFDSFKGIPPNDEVHRNLDGRPVVFRPGAFAGRLPVVRRAVERFGAPAVCTFHKGWFEDSLRDFRADVDVAVLDVDLLSSTRTCLTALFPRLRPGGVLFSQDGHLEAIVALFRDDAFWASIGVRTPAVTGLGADKLLEAHRLA